MAQSNLKSVISRLDGLRIRLLLRLLLRSVPRLVVLGVGLALATFLLDFLLELPRGVRVVLLLVSLGLLALEGFRHLVRGLLNRPTTDELAILVEGSDPEIRDQLISAIQLERDLAAGQAVESPELIQALVDDTSRRFADHSFGSAISLRSCVRPVLAGLGAIVAIWVLGAAFPSEAGLWVERQLLLRDTPWPRETTLVEIPDIEKYDPRSDGERTILFVPERTPLQVRVMAIGKLPDSVDLVAAPEDDPEVSQVISMGRPQGKDYFQHIFPPLTRSLTFHAEGGDDDDGVPLYELRVARAPRVVSYWCDYDYPDYTGIEDRTLPDTNVSAPEGTRVTMHFRTNMELAEFALDFDSMGSVAPTALPDGSYRHSFVIEENDFYTYRLRGTNGVSSPDLPRYVITAEADQSPRISVDLPGYTVLSASANGTIPLKGTVTDDYGVTEVGLRWGAGRGSLDLGALEFSDEDLRASRGQAQVPFFHALDVSTLRAPAQSATPERPATEERPLGEGDRIAFRFLAADNRRTPTAPEPHRAFGDYEYQVQILSKEELERELGQRQTRMKERIRNITTLVESRMEDTRALLAKVRQIEGDQSEELRSLFWQVEQDQNRITQELQGSTRHFLRVYDGYLWNRLDPGNLSETLIVTLCQLHRGEPDADAARIYGQAIREVEPLIDEGQLQGRLTVILGIMLRTATERSPEAHRRLARASLVSDHDERVDLVRSALEEQTLLLEDLLLLVDKLEAWEDFLDVIQGFRDLIDLESGIKKKIEKITDK